MVSVADAKLPDPDRARTMAPAKVALTIKTKIAPENFSALMITTNS
jgi:hypothetical protein